MFVPSNKVHGVETEKNETLLCTAQLTLVPQKLYSLK